MGVLKPRRFGLAEGQVPCFSQPSYAPDDWFKRYPTLWEFCTRSLWEGDVVRKTGTVLLFAEDGQWKACLNDRDGECVAFVTAGSPVEALASVEKGLKGDTLDWRLTAAGKQKKRK